MPVGEFVFVWIVLGVISIVLNTASAFLSGDRVMLGEWLSTSILILLLAPLTIFICLIEFSYELFKGLNKIVLFPGRSK